MKRKVNFYIKHIKGGVKTRKIAFFLVTLQDMNSSTEKKSKAHIIFKIITSLIFLPIILLWVVIILLYVPPVQKFAVEKICQTVNENSEYNLSIGGLHLAFPLTVTVNDFTLAQDSNIIVSGKQIAVNIRPATLLKGEFEVNYVSVDHTSLNTYDMIDGMRINGRIGHFRTTARNVDVIKEKVVIRQIHLADTQIDIALTEKKQDDEEEDSTSAPPTWVVELRNGNIRNFRLGLDMPHDTTSINAVIENFKIDGAKADLASNTFEAKRVFIDKSRFSYDTGTAADTIAPLEHLHIDGIGIETGYIKYSENDINADIKKIAFAQKGGIHVNECTIQLHADSSNVNIENIAMKTKNGSYIDATATIPTAMINGGNGGRMNSKIAMYIDKRDIKGFVPQATYNDISFLPDSLLTARLSAHGNLGIMQIDTIATNIPTLLSMGAKGYARNLHDTKHIDARLNLRGAVQDISRMIQGQHIPDSIEKQRMSIGGTIALVQDEADIALGMRVGQQGRAAVKAKYNIANDTYDARARIKRMNISNIIPSAALHELTMRISADGKGTDIFSPQTSYNIKAQIDTLRYDSIFLQKIDLNATQNNSLSNITLTTQSPNLQMTFEAATRIDSSSISNKSHMAVEKAELHSFGITAAPLTVGFVFDIDADTDMQQTHKVTMKGDKFRLATAQKTFTPAPLYMQGATSPEMSYVRMNTGDLNINSALDTGYMNLLAAFERIKELYTQTRYSEKSLFYAQDFEKELPAMSVDIECGQKNIVANFLRFHKVEFSDFNLHVAIDSLKGINSAGGLYNLKKEDMQIDTLRFFMRQNENKIRYFAGIRTRSLDPNQPKLKFYSALYGSLHNDSLTTNFVFRDNNDNVGAKIGLNTILRPQGLDFRFMPKATLLNRPFHFNDDNYISLHKNLEIRGYVEMKDSTNSGMRLYTSNDSTLLHDISAELFNIDLKAVTSILPFAPEMQGTLNADLHMRQNDGLTMFSSDIRGDSIMYNGVMLGNETLELAYLPKGNTAHYVDVSLIHNDEQIFNLNGDYHDNNGHPLINGEANLMRFPLKLSDAFIKETGLHLNGYINGALAVEGEIEDIASNGYVHFDSVHIDAPILGTTLRMPDDKLSIVDNKLTFNNFNIYAKGDTPFQVNGDIDFKELINPEFNLRMLANNYELVNAKRRKGAMLYGNLALNINSFVRGTLNSLKMYGQATVLGSSNITYVMLDSPLAAESELDGLVQFVNFADTTQVAKSNDEEIDFGNMTMNITLNIEERARINADFDENRTSYIELQGGGNLYMTYTSEAGIGLTGRYTLNNGQLKYTLPIIPLKTFNIKEGSYINWTGDLMNPTLNITALERMTSSVTLDDGNAQAVAFDVGVELSNTLDDMGLSFTMSAPENAAVQDELNSVDKETLNKYAVTMLVTGAYLGSDGGITVSNALSSFIDAKINDIAGNAMKSVDINVGITDVENNETGGTYKNYSFSFAKRFWNDRLTVIIGGEVNSGDTNNKDNSFINNVSLEWRLSETGNRYIRLFYDKNYESILEGEIIETGVGYVYKRKLDNLKELFVFRKKDDNEMLMINSRR